jgi:hypothetical protein
MGFIVLCRSDLLIVESLVCRDDKVTTLRGLNMLPLKLSSRKRRSRSGVSSLSLIWLLACVSAGLWVLLGGSSTPAPAVPQASDAATAEAVAFGEPDAAAAEPRTRYRPIDQIRVGQRVVTPETDPGASLPTAVDRSTWKLLTLEWVSAWPDGTRDRMHVRTLQPPQWLAAHHAQVGARVPVPLDLREMGVPAGQPAEVVAVDPCPAITDGPGRVVLTTVNHLNAFLFDLKVNGERGPPQDLEVTGWHKLYSEDRQAWTSVCELHAGEALRGRDGPLTVASLTRRPGVQRVYNLTVEAEHQYYVSGLDLLAHNANCRGSGPAKGFVEVSDTYDSSKAVQNFNATSWRDFVFDSQSERFIMGRRSTLGHDAFREIKGIVPGEGTPGGRIFSENDKLFTNEHSGHYGQYWTPEIRQQFVDFMDRHGVNITHIPWTE